MKGSFLWKLAYVFCVLAGLLAGYGAFSLSKGNDGKINNITKDSTLRRESGDSVLFSTRNDDLQQIEIVKEKDDREGELTPSVTPVITAAISQAATPSPVLTEVPTEKNVFTEPEEMTKAEDILPSLGSHWVISGITMAPEEKPIVVEEEKKSLENTMVSEAAADDELAEEVITYPAKIFGQTPIINRSDAYVSYFEFCYDLVSMMESEVQAKGLNMNALMTKFALKALFCGVDIEKLNINAPIPRRLAALCLWLAAQVLNEEGSDTTSKSAENYVTDISSCSSVERKAIAYLYEQGVVKGYQVAGQKFYPQEGLKTESGSRWLSGIKSCWK